MCSVCACPLAGSFLPSNEHLVSRLACVRSYSQHFIRKVFKECTTHILEVVLTTDSSFGSHVFLSAEYCSLTEALSTKIPSVCIYSVLYSNKKYKVKLFL
jgi:hypothetical protein